MAGICGKIIAGVIHDCDNPPSSGTKADVRVADFDDVMGYTEDVLNPLLITDILMASATSFFKFEGTKQSVGHTSKLTQGTYRPQHDHSLTFVCFDNAPDTKLTLTKLAGRRVVCIHENVNKGDGGDSSFEVSGRKAGLVLNVMERDANDGETGGGWKLELKSEEGNMEPMPPSTFFDTNYATTLAKVEALTA